MCAMPGGFGARLFDPKGRTRRKTVSTRRVVPTCQLLEPRCLLATDPGGTAAWLSIATSAEQPQITPQSITATAGQPITAVVATFVPPAGSGAGEFAAQIDWGDGSAMTPAELRVGPTAVEVVGTHTYASLGNYPLQVVIVETGTMTRTVGAPSVATVTGAASPPNIVLARGSDSGVSPFDNITNVSEPTFEGSGAEPFAIIQIYAQKNGSVPTNIRYLGQTIANESGDWSFVSPTLHDGVYTISAVQTKPNSMPSTPTYMEGRLIIDTIAPRVAGFQVRPANNQIVVVLGDVGSGIADVSLRPDNYLLIPPDMRTGRPPGPNGQGGNVASRPSISGFYSTATAAVLEFSLRRGRARPAPARWVFQINAPGVIDRAGNALDGEFTRSLPSGNGRAGGNFIVRFVLPPKPKGKSAAGKRR